MRLQHSPDLEENAKIVSLLPFQLLLYMIVVPENIYTPHPRGALLLQTPTTLEFPFQQVLVIPPPPVISVIIQLDWVPHGKNICVKNVVALYYYYVKDNFFCDKVR